jgi:hypothetical protein
MHEQFVLVTIDRGKKTHILLCGNLISYQNNMVVLIIHQNFSSSNFNISLDCNKYLAIDIH